MKARNGPRAETRNGPDPADVEVLDPLGQPDLEARVGHELVDALEE